MNIAPQSRGLHFLKKRPSGRVGLKIDLAIKVALPSQSVFRDASDRRAKDGGYKMCLAVSGRLGPVEPVAGNGVAWPKPLAIAGPAGGHPLRPRAADRDDLAPRRRSQSRLPRLLLLPGGTR